MAFHAVGARSAGGIAAPSLLDAIDRPRYAGGIGEVSRIAARAASRVSWDVLLELRRKWRSSALAQRLGYFLDLHGVQVPRETRRGLLELVLPHSKIQLGSRRKWGTSGRLARPWNVVENVPRDVLLAKEDPRIPRGLARASLSAEQLVADAPTFARPPQ